MQTELGALDLRSQHRHIGDAGGGENLLSKALDESSELKRIREVGKGRAVMRWAT
jgi:hypothetical protein